MVNKIKILFVCIQNRWRSLTADIIFVMEKKHARRIQDKFRSSLLNKRVICLNIPDDYQYMDEDLVGLLESSVSEYISHSGWIYPLKRDHSVRETGGYGANIFAIILCILGFVITNIAREITRRNIQS